MADLYDVIVVGGGPVGSYVAGKLSQQGCRTLVLERREQVGAKPCCTGLISQTCADLLSLKDDVCYRHVNSAQLYSPSGNLVYLSRPEPQAVVVNRAAFDREMMVHAQQSGATYSFGAAVTNIVTKSDYIALQTIDGDKHVARAAVIATGFSFNLTEQLGLGKIGDFVVGTQAEVSTDAQEIRIYTGSQVAPGFFAWLVPTRDGRGLAGLLARHHAAEYLNSFLSRLKEEGLISTVGKIRFGAIPLKPLAKSYSHRVLVVGDAAGQTKPLTGGGIYYGLLCADIAARTLDEGLKTDNLSAEYLANYQRQWHAKLQRELNISYRARQIFEHLNDSNIDKIFAIIKSRGIEQALLAHKEISFDWHAEAILRLLTNETLSRLFDIINYPLIGNRRKLWRQTPDE